MEVFKLKKDIGLVFAGGGAKGSYQIGVWKALKGMGIDKYIGAVSGTSIGALNGAMFCTGDYDQAYNAWMHVREDSVLIKNHGNRTNKSPYESWFSNAGINHFIDSYVNFKKIPDGLECYVTASRIVRPGIYNIMKNCSQKDILGKIISVFLIPLLHLQTKAVTFLINDYQPTEINDILLASSAIPLVFPDISIHGRTYVDGGINDNIPIRPLYEKGYRKIIVVTLEEEIKINMAGYDKVKAVHLNINEPNPFANFIETFDFAQAGIQARMEKGYQDGIFKSRQIHRLL